VLRTRARRHTPQPKIDDHVRALRSRLHASPDATPEDRRMARLELEALLDALDRPAPEGNDGRTAEVLSRVLVDAGAPTAALVREHAEQFGDLLPTVLLADLARWYVAAVTGPVTGSRAVAERVAVGLAEAFRDGDGTTRAIIATGFLETLPRPGELGGEVAARLPRRLGRELAAMRRG
jgi:DNA-binding PucR family transcriptional regulator